MSSLKKLAQEQITDTKSTSLFKHVDNKIEEKSLGPHWVNIRDNIWTKYSAFKISRGTRYLKKICSKLGLNIQIEFPETNSSATSKGPFPLDELV